MKSFQSYESGREIQGAGEPVEFVGSVISGVVKLIRLMADGRQQLVGLLFQGDFVGRNAQAFSDHYAVAATPVTLCRFRRIEFETMMDSHPHLMRRHLTMTLNELDATRDWLTLLGRKTAREKTASFLCLLSERIGEKNERGDISFQIPITRDDMADYLGLTIETVSRQMSSLKREGLIEFGTARSITVPDYATLLEASGDDADGGLVP